jgi:predicted nuclease of predicted toxin-antitoxin system
MRLLFDHNLSPRLVSRLADLYSDATHTVLIALDRATDLEVWSYAQVHGFAIVTKDTDFSDMSVIRGYPPKVILLRLGNCTTVDIENVLRNSSAEIAAFADDPSAGVLELF